MPNVDCPTKVRWMEFKPSQVPAQPRDHDDLCVRCGVDHEPACVELPAKGKHKRDRLGWKCRNCQYMWVSRTF